MFFQALLIFMLAIELYMLIHAITEYSGFFMFHYSPVTRSRCRVRGPPCPPKQDIINYRSHLPSRIGGIGERHFCVMGDPELSPQAHVGAPHVANQRHHAPASRLHCQDGARDELLRRQLDQCKQDCIQGVRKVLALFKISETNATGSYIFKNRIKQRPGATSHVPSPTAYSM